MSFKKFSLAERQERARVIYNTGVQDWFTSKYLKRHLPEAKEQLYKHLSSSSKFTEFLEAALRIRKNYSQWKTLLKNPSGPVPKVFASFADNKMLVFYLFLGDHLNVFHLDPLFSFILSDERRSPKCFLIHGKQDDILSNVRYVVKMWKSMGMPWKDSRCGKDFTGMAEILQNPIERANERGNLCVAWHFWEFTTQFQLDYCFYNPNKHDQDVTTLLFDIEEFTNEASIALAFDQHGVNTLDIIHELFPEIPELVPYTIKTYWEYRNIVKKKKGPNAELKRAVLEEKFKCKLTVEDATIETSTSLLNRSILQIFKKYPELPNTVDGCDDPIFQNCNDSTDELARDIGKMLRVSSNFYEREYTLFFYTRREGNMPCFRINEGHHTRKHCLKEKQCAGLSKF